MRINAGGSKRRAVVISTALCAECGERSAVSAYRGIRSRFALGVIVASDTLRSGRASVEADRFRSTTIRIVRASRTEREGSHGTVTHACPVHCTIRIRSQAMQRAVLVEGLVQTPAGGEQSLLEVHSAHREVFVPEFTHLAGAVQSVSLTHVTQRALAVAGLAQTGFAPRPTVQSLLFVQAVQTDSGVDGLTQDNVPEQSESEVQTVQVDWKYTVHTEKYLFPNSHI